MTTKSDFTEEEWTRVVRAPLVAGLAISLADPGGPIEMAKESMASLKNATNPPSREQLLAEVALEIQGMAQRRENPLKGYKPRPTPGAPTPGDAVIEELTAVQALVASKATPDEATAFATWLARPRPRRRPTPPRTAGSWVSAPSRSATANRR